MKRDRDITNKRVLPTRAQCEAEREAAASEGELLYRGVRCRYIYCMVRGGLREHSQVAVIGALGMCLQSRKSWQ